MSLSEAFLVIVRWLHLVSAAAWVGGSLFYLIVLRPAQRRAPDTTRAFSVDAAAEFGGLVNICIIVLIATGIILTLNRLTPGDVGTAYVIALGVKIAFSVWMFVLAWSRRKRTSILDAFRGVDAPDKGRVSRLLRTISGYNALVILGLIVFLISDLLKVMYEMALR